MVDGRGRSGLDGLDGPSAYEIAKAYGFKGSPAEWIASLKGDRGDPGESVPEHVVRDLVAAAVAEIKPIEGKAGPSGLDGLPGARGPMGERGERGMEGAAAELPPLVPWRADYYRAADTRLVLRVRAGPSDGSGPFINLIPVRGDDLLIEYVDLIPEPG